MKILKIIHGYPPQYNAGSEVYSLSLCTALARQHEVVVFTREENLYTADYTMRTERRGGVLLYIVNMARAKDGYAHPRIDALLAALIAHERPDVAHIGHLNHLSTGLVAVLRAGGVPIAFTLHDFWLMCPRGQFLQINFGNSDFHQLCEGQDDRKCAKHCYNRFFTGEADEAQHDIDYWTHWVARRMQITRALAEAVDVFIAPSEYLRQRFIQGFGLAAERVQYLDYGFPLHYLRPLAPVERTVFTFGYIGTHIPSKGIDGLITAFSRLTQKACLKIWGRDLGQSTAALKAMAAHCDKPIEFLGEYVNTNLAATVFANVDCIVVPSTWGENAPLVIHEAQACRLPVITANYGGMAEYVAHLQNGLLFEHRNTDSLTEQLAFAAQNPALMRQLGARGYLYADDGAVPSIEVHTAQLMRIYTSIIAK